MKTLLALVLFLTSYSIGISQTTISLEDVDKHIGDSVTVCGRVSSGRFLEQAKGSPTFLNLGKVFPNHALTVVLWNDMRKQFEKAPELLFKDQEICVTGRIELYKERPQIVIRRKEDIKLK